MQIGRPQGTTEFSETSLAGLKLARSFAHMYSDQPEVRAVIAGGSVARGCADEYSDVEIGVFWETPPSDAVRRDAIRRMGGEVWRVRPLRPTDEPASTSACQKQSWTLKPYRGTAMVSPIHMSVDAAEEWIGAFIDDLDTAPKKYELAAAISYGLPLYGHDLIEGWEKEGQRLPQTARGQAGTAELVVGALVQMDCLYRACRPLGDGTAPSLDAARDSQCAGSSQPRVPAVGRAQVGGVAAGKVGD